MRAALLVLALPLALGGCSGLACKNAGSFGEDCSYGVGPVVATAWFEDEAWNAPLVEKALRDMGYELEAVTGDVVATRFEQETELLARRETNGTTRLDIEFRPDDLSLGYTRAEAQRILDEMERDARPRADAILARFEEATGWTHDAGPAWSRAMSVA